MRIIYTLPLLLISGCGQPKDTSPNERGNKSDKRVVKNSRKHRDKRMTRAAPRDTSMKIPVYVAPVTVKNDIEPISLESAAAKIKTSSENEINAEVQTHEVNEDVSVLPVKEVDRGKSESVIGAPPVEDSKRKKNNKRSHATQTREKTTGSEHRVPATKVRSSNEESSREEKKKARSKETPRAHREGEPVTDSNRKHKERTRTHRSEKIRAPVVRRNPGCDERKVAAARGLIDNDSHDLFLIRQYAPFLTTCVKHIGDREIEELLTEKAWKALLILREVARVPLYANIPESREKMDAEIDFHWAQVRMNPGMLKKVVSLPNLGLLRYIAGAEEGTRILLENGGLLALWHSKDVDCQSPCKPVQIRESLETMLAEPLKQLLLEAQKSKSESALFRPKYQQDVEFVWGEQDRSLNDEMRAQIVKPIPDALRIVNEVALRGSNFVTERFVKTFKLKNTYPAAIDAVFREGMNEFSPPFTLMNLQDRDKLYAVVGRGLAPRLLDDRAQVVIHSLLRYSTDNCKSNCPYAELYHKLQQKRNSYPVSFFLDEIIPRLRNLHDIAGNSNRNYISFLVGLTAGPLMAAHGFDAQVHVCKVLSDKCGTKVSIPLWDAFFPTDERIAQAFRSTIEDQLQDLREREIPIFEL